MKTMNNGTEYYQKLIDEFVEMSRSCVSSESAYNAIGMEVKVII